MSMLVKNSAFETKLEAAAKQTPMRTKKTSLMVAIADAALDAAQADGVGIETIVKELRDRALGRRAKVA